MKSALNFGNPFRGALVVLALAAGAFAASHFAHADTVPTSLQHAHTGVWYDPGHSGEGVELFVDNGADTAFVTIFAGAVDGGSPTWFTAYVPTDGSADAVPLYLSNHVFNGRPSGGDLLQVGTLTLEVDSCTELSARINLGAPYAEQMAQWSLVPLVQPNVAECRVCDGFSPPLAGCPAE